MIRVVVVDDQTLVRVGLRTLLADEPDVELVGEAGDGREALAVIRSVKPDVVLMDMGLPRCDGATAVRQIRSDPAFTGLRIFAVTASAPNGFDIPHGPAGIDRWFQKPLDPASLLHELKQELGASPCAV